MLGSKKNFNLRGIAKKITAAMLSLTVVTSSILAFDLNSEKFSISSGALTQNWCDVIVLSQDLVSPYADFSPFLDTEKEIYDIETAEQLAAFSILTNSMPDPRITVSDDEWPRFRVNPYDSNSPTVEPTFFTDKTIRLAADINLSGFEFLPIAAGELMLFNGIFDGNNKTIRNVNIGTKISFNGEERDIVNGYGGAGLFGNVRGEIKNLNVEFLSLSADCACIGGVAASVEGDISNVTLVNSVIDVNHADHVGGIVGKLAGNISSAKVYNTSINVDKAVNVGGVLGCTDKENSYNYGKKASEEYKSPDNARINKILDTSAYDVKITASAENIGGIAGNLDVIYTKDKLVFLQLFSSLIKNTKIETRGASNVGGICGYISNGQIRDCSSDHLSSVTHVTLGESNVGGIIGYIVDSETWKNLINDSTIKVINGTGNDERVDVGGVVGKAYNVILDDCLNLGTMLDIEASYVGGIVGSGKKCFIIECKNIMYSLHAINASIGGIIGLSVENKINKSSSRSHIQTDITKEGTVVYVGGLIGISRLDTTTYLCNRNNLIYSQIVGAITHADNF